MNASIVQNFADYADVCFRYVCSRSAHAVTYASPAVSLGTIQNTGSLLTSRGRSPYSATIWVRTARLTGPAFSLLSATAWSAKLCVPPVSRVFCVCMLSPHAFSTGIHPPARCSNRQQCSKGNSSIEAYAAGHNVLLSHAAAVDIYRKKYQATQGGEMR